MRKYFLVAAALLILPFLARPASGQSNQFRDTRAHLAVGVGLFTYYGPIDLSQPQSGANYVQPSDPAVVLLGSFPIVGDRFYFRGLVGFTNFNAPDKSLDTYGGDNEFLRHQLFFFEPEVIYTLSPGSRSRILPYVYTGFGGLLADAFGSSGNQANQPGSGVPGPERSVFSIPFGLGLDFALSPRFSFFFDASYRFNLNYVWKNEINGTNPHNTSLVMGGLRLGLVNPFRQEPPPVAIGPMPDPLPIPRYQPPPPPDQPPPDRCVLVELNTVYFAFDSTELDAEARALLQANLEALRSQPECCVEVVGYTDRGDASSAYVLRIARQRAEAVYRYYLAGGLETDRIRVRAEGLAFPACDKEDDGPGCRRNRRVDSIPIPCF